LLHEFWLIFYCWFVWRPRSRIFHWYGEVTIVCEAPKKIGLYLAHRALGQEGSSLCHIYCDTGRRIFRSQSETIPFIRLLRHARGC
jgi:hypothetical protein